MQFDELVRVLKHIGINNTFQVLSQFDDLRAEKHQFYNKLNKFSYYNAYVRVREELLKRDIIYIRQFKKQIYIGLTEKGKELYQKLTELNDIIKS